MSSSERKIYIICTHSEGMPDLKEYIKDLQKQGYPLQSIKGILLRYGYQEQVVDQTIYNLDHKPQFHLTPQVILAALGVILILSGSLYFLIKPPQQIPQKLLDVSIENIPLKIKPGEALEADVLFTNMGSRQRYDIFTKYEIFDTGSRRLTFKSETLALEDLKNKITQIIIPENAKAGSYVLVVTARYQAEIAKAEQPFEIVSEQQQIQQSTCSDGIQNQGEEKTDCGGPCPACSACIEECDDNDPATEDICNAQTGFSCVHKRIAVCGDKICESPETDITCPSDCTALQAVSEGNVWDKLDEIKQMANTLPQQALRECGNIEPSFKDQCLQQVGTVSQNADICNDIEDAMRKDRCYTEIAKTTEKVVLCEQVAEKRRDSCYMNLALKEHFEVCGKINNPYQKRSCETLRDANQFG